MYNKIFISYAREDYQFALELFNYLEENNFKPWLDKKKLLVGERWESTLMLELKLSDFIILLLSDTSVTKRGFVRREFRKALRYAEEKLESDIFILPIKIDDCTVPEELSIFNWHSYSELMSSGDLLKSLNFQRSKLIKSTPKELLEVKQYYESNLQLEGAIAKILNYTILFPKFHSSLSIDVRVLNVEIESYINNELSFIYNNYRDELFGVNRISAEEGYPIIFYIDYIVGTISENFVSVLFTTYYGIRYSTKSINVSFNPNYILDQSIIQNSDELISFIEVYNHQFDDETYSGKKILDEISMTSYGNRYLKDFEFFVHDEFIQIDFSNHLAHAVKALGIFQFNYIIQNGKIKILEPKK
jgi:hypothetical protein